MAHPILLLINFPLLIFGALALNLDPVGLVYAPASLGKRQVTYTGDAERPYGVDGDTFTEYESAAARSYNNKFNSCQKTANANKSSAFTLQDCQDQLNNCMSTISSTSVAPQAVTMASETTASASTSDENNIAPQFAQTTIPYDSEFDLVCDLPEGDI
ncbi:uncharacterized protein BDW43DRAFT_213404 [Aspergillus alliaceus]|uniref:uncharacterized protein n=1 Tax=Petromyces alliaceus TaxID=209559 RepID=UPI0012A54700|nr:uncharacterized protein BDW43DRAFT_213404 [Aspergillus alliaceus]KAB8228557.1 hypothetical protein BDW43DRAFT_213404 [Aspergillus alliaceus]